MMRPLVWNRRRWWFVTRLFSHHASHRFGFPPAGQLAAMDITSKLEQAQGLDRVVGFGQRVARQLPPGRLRDGLNGVWLGHPVHPSLVQAPLGAWLSAAVLDGWQSVDARRGGSGRAGCERAARRLVAFGVLAVVPAALAGAADWSEQHEQQMRVGVVHLLTVTAATGLYGASLAAGDPRRSRALRFAGLAAAGVGGLLGGHIAFRQAGGANHAEAVSHLVEPGWHDVAAVENLPGDRPARVMLGEIPLLVVADGERFQVLADRCSHLSGPLSDGELDDGCITCPWHGSVFRLGDGSVARGPATAPQPVFETRTRDGILQVRLPGAG
jgi:nitrite reductase/ring-hydroxylating ferredoxin subunit